MSRIQEYVEKNNIKPSGCLYHTQRTAKNSKGQPAGKMRILVPKSDAIARVEYTCPECSHESYTEQEWKRPFWLKCEKCGYKMTVPKMKQEFKKEQKGG